MKLTNPGLMERIIRILEIVFYYFFNFSLKAQKRNPPSMQISLDHSQKQFAFLSRALTKFTSWQLTLPVHTNFLLYQVGTVKKTNCGCSLNCEPQENDYKHMRKQNKFSHF